MPWREHIQVEFLPAASQREWVVASLGDLVSRRGHAPLVQGLIVELTTTHFPEHISRSLGGAEIVARRLLRYAGLESLRVVMDLYSEDCDECYEPTANGHEILHRGSAAVFRGIEDDRCYFGVNTSTFEDMEALPAALAHEVAHAFRARHGLTLEDTTEEERLTDLTAVYLGFGVLLANASERYRSVGSMEDTYTSTSWSDSRLGYLPMQTMCFALAVQAVLRGDRSTRQAIKGRLAPNQAACFAASVKWLEAERAELDRRVVIPDAKSWAAARSMEELLRPMVAEAVDPPEGVPARIQRLPNEGRLVFRVRATRWAAGLARGSLAALAATVAYGVVFHRSLPWWFALVVIVAGWRLGHRIRADHCSDPECQALVLPTATECPGCGGEIGGELRSANDRLAAEELLARAGAHKPGRESDDDAA